MYVFRRNEVNLPFKLIGEIKYSHMIIILKHLYRAHLHSRDTHFISCKYIQRHNFLHNFNLQLRLLYQKSITSGQNHIKLFLPIGMCKTHNTIKFHITDIKNLSTKEWPTTIQVVFRTLLNFPTLRLRECKQIYKNTNFTKSNCSIR